ncbi:hypothetical protein V6N12_000387 [Hibiscus sabdariffa]|uniref:Uncharacterized protein n=1 Tax=Hibiscus sabdariffa TaxID=183260 RepID=A0ABR2BIF3_9ROSI
MIAQLQRAHKPARATEPIEHTLGSYGSRSLMMVTTAEEYGGENPRSAEMTQRFSVDLPTPKMQTKKEQGTTKLTNTKLEEDDSGSRKLKEEL